MPPSLGHNVDRFNPRVALGLVITFCGAVCMAADMLPLAMHWFQTF